MSSARHKTGLPSSEFSKTAHADCLQMYAQFSDGLHAMAQPLTVLRAVISAFINPGISAADRQKYMEISAEQVENVCSLFQCLQELVAVSQNPAACEQLELNELLDLVDKAQKQIMRKAGVELVLDAPGRLKPALGDKDRTIQALFAVLKITMSISSPGDRIELGAMSLPEGIQLSIRNLRADGKHLKSAQRLILSLAETNILSQHGKYKVFDEPWKVILTLPVQKVIS